MQSGIRIGCCGFPRRRPEYYAHFSLVEVQQTFYKPPLAATARRWRDEAPPGFEFTLKAWQLITHEPSSPTYRKAGLRLEGPPEHYGAFRGTPEVMAAWDRTVEIARALEAGAILLQCPARFTPSDEHLGNLRTFLATAIEAGIPLAWEPRGDWADALIGEVCGEFNLIQAVDPFQRRPATAGRAYFRLHGIGGYAYRYTRADLERLLRWCQDFDTAYCFFNNISMWEDALLCQEMAGG